MARRKDRPGPLESRSAAILRAIIEEYVATASPVGSLSLVAKYRLGVSPATVRNVMAELEAAGFLGHPHTSAGRIPTDMGYRLYVESIGDVVNLAPVEQLMIRHQFGQVEFASEQWFRLAAATLAGVLFGCAPAWYASRLDPAGALTEGGRSGIGVSRHRLRRILVIAEFALALPLLAGAGLAIHSFWNLTRVDLGFRTDHILGFYVDPPPWKDLKQTRMTAYYRSILAGIAAVPGVSHVSVMAHLPLDTYHYPIPFTIAGKQAYTNASPRPSAYLQTITPDYFQTFGIRIVKGRGFTDADNASSLRVAMVDEAFVSRFLEGVDPLQQRVVMELGIAGEPKNGPPLEWQIVGVFHTVKSRGFQEYDPEIDIEDHPEIDIPLWQMAYPVLGIAVRTAEDPASMTKSILTAVNMVDPQAATFEPRSMEEMRDAMLANDRFAVILFAGFAVVGLLLAAVGIHGVTAFSAAQRSHEIAVRMALGATRNRVVALVVKEGLVLACIGLGLGLVGAYFLGRAMQSILFGVGTIDFLTLDGVGAILLLTAFLACYLPTQKATRSDPMVALRHE